MRIRQEPLGRGRSATLSTARSRRVTPEQAMAHALDGLQQFIRGMDKLPDEAIQVDDLLLTVSEILDDKLIESMEFAFEHSLFSEVIEDPGVDALWPQWNMLQKLRDLQKIRLRDAMARMLNQSPS